MAQPVINPKCLKILMGHNEFMRFKDRAPQKRANAV
jgi:hypothetical protein